MANIEILSDQPYFEPDTIKINIHNIVHQGKFWQHTHAFFEFVYVVEGFALHSYNGDTSILAAGDLFAIYPGNVHSYNAAYNTKIFNVLFYIDELGEAGEEISSMLSLCKTSENERDSLPIVNVPFNERHTLVSLISAMVTEREQKRIGWELNLKSMLTCFIVMCTRLMSEKSTAKSNDHRSYSGYICTALKYIEDNYKNEISSADIAAAAGLSSDYLTKLFKNVMSITPIEYVRKFRIAKSMNLLHDTNMPISKVAAAAGFSDASIFSRAFKQVTGMTPALFRRQ